MKHVKDLFDHGIALIERAVPTKLCDKINSDFESYCARFPEESDKFLLKTGRHSRLTNMHVTSRAARLGFSRVARRLDEIFGQRAAIYSSLYFEQSSEQALHRDSPYFCTVPYGRYLGVWVALEDVSPLAGPLQYVQGAHRLEVSRDHPSVDAYQASVAAACEGRDRSIVTPKKGDVVVWHPELPHGGTPIQESGRTRKSIVFHVCPEHTAVFGEDVFLMHRPPDKTKEEHYTKIEKGRKMYSLSSPAFAPNN